MTEGKITNKDLYQAINDLRQELGHNIETLQLKVDENTNWRNQVTGKLTVLMIVVGTAINWMWDRLFYGK